MTDQTMESFSNFCGDFGSSFETVVGECAEHGHSPTLVRTGKPWHCTRCFEALIKAETGDRWGNLTYRKAARNFGPVMATAAKKTIATVHEVVALGALDPEHIITPGIYVHHVVKIARVATQAGGFKQ